jgi:hypothetical protein
LVWSNSSEVAHWQLVTTGKAAAGAEQSSDEAGQMVEGRTGVGGSFLGDVWNRDKGFPIHVGRRQPATTENRVARGNR